MSESIGGGRGSSTGSGASSAQTSASSNHDLSARTLKDRGIRAAKKPATPRLFTEDAALNIISSLLKSKIGCDGEKVNDLIRAFGEPCSNEDSFDGKTFNAFVDCFQSGSVWSLVDSGDENLKILRKGGATGVGGARLGGQDQSEDADGRDEDAFTVTVTSHRWHHGKGKCVDVTGRYAIGLARRKAVPAKKGCIVEVETFPDHAWVVVWKQGQEKSWRVCQVLSAVEVKIEDKACKLLAKTSDGCVDPSSIDLGKNGGCGPLAQEIMYVFGHVLWSRAALGLSLPKSLPFAVISAEKMRPVASARQQAHGDMPPLAPKPKQVLSDKARWVHGSLTIPEQCGGAFTYAVDSFGIFRETTGRSALAVYLDVMMDGFDAGTNWLERLQTDKGSGVPDENLFGPSAMSGRELRFGATTILESRDMRVLGSPARMHANLCLECVASQGEFFRREVDLAKLRKQVSSKDLVFWCPEDEFQQETESVPREESSVIAKESAVIVKVASSSCHARLHEQGCSLLAQLAPYMPVWWKKASKYLRSSLYAVYIIRTSTPQPSVIQLMPDLQAMGYVPLCPEHVVDRQRMCQAFKSLVQGTLLPLARENIIHCDIRPGYRATANILYHPKEQVMRLIDLDSHLIFEMHYMTLLEDERLVSHQNGLQGEQISSALEFVLLQAVCVASVWSSRTNEVRTELIIKNYWEMTDRDVALKALEAEETSDSYILGEFDRLVALFLEGP